MFRLPFPDSQLISWSVLYCRFVARTKQECSEDGVIDTHSGSLHKKKESSNNDPRIRCTIEPHILSSQQSGQQRIAICNPVFSVNAIKRLKSRCDKLLVISHI